MTGTGRIEEQGMRDGASGDEVGEESGSVEESMKAWIALAIQSKKM